MYSVSGSVRSNVVMGTVKRTSTGYVESAAAFQVVFLVSNNEDNIPKAMEWELGFLDVVEKFAANAKYINMYYSTEVSTFIFIIHLSSEVALHSIEFIHHP
jgi:hypothetical protein